MTDTQAPPPHGAVDPLHYLVLDLETTGLGRDHDLIVEIAAAGVSRNLDTVLFSYATPIRYTGHQLVDVLARVTSFPPAARMHADSGLWDGLRSGAGVTLQEAEAELTARIDLYRSGDQSLVLAGSGVSHFDMAFLTRLTPTLAAHLHYSTRDVGIMRRFYLEQTGVDLCDANDRKTHRAADDVACHLEEMRAFRDLFLTHHTAGEAADDDR